MLNVFMNNSVPSVLEKILAVKVEEIRSAQARTSRSEMRTRALRRLNDDKPRGFSRALTDQVDAARSGKLVPPAVIAEIKRASPSRGIIRDPFDPVAIARSYEMGGATCLSVLTDRQFFQGVGHDLTMARDACSLPVLRKDFIIDSYQVDEACTLGADAILLIMAVLNEPQSRSLHAAARELQLDVLVEVHNRSELERALRMDDVVIGINNRNLHDFSVNLKTTIGLLEDVPSDRFVVTESGVLSVADIALMRKNGVHAFLIGEAFMRARDPGAELKSLIASGGATVAQAPAVEED